MIGHCVSASATQTHNSTTDWLMPIKCLLKEECAELLGVWIKTNSSQKAEHRTFTGRVDTTNNQYINPLIDLIAGCPTWGELRPSHHKAAPGAADIFLPGWPSETHTRAHSWSRFLATRSAEHLPELAEPHLEPRVGDVRVFEGQQLGAERALVVVNGFVNLQEGKQQRRLTALASHDVICL